MNSLWTQGIKKGTQEYKDIEEAYRASAFLRKRMLEMLDSILEEEMKAKTSDNAYDNANWAYKQADSIGYIRAIKRIKASLSDRTKNNL